MNAEDTAIRWLSEEEAVRSRIARGTGFARPEQLAGRTGLEILRAMLAGEIPARRCPRRSTSC